jgi:hypothetical protein
MGFQRRGQVPAEDHFRIYMFDAGRVSVRAAVTVLELGWVEPGPECDRQHRAVRDGDGTVARLRGAAKILAFADLAVREPDCGTYSSGMARDRVCRYSVPRERC